MKQQLTQTWQHLPLEMQTSKMSAKEVQKSLKQSKHSEYTAEDLMGLSWVLFEEKEDYS